MFRNIQHSKLKLFKDCSPGSSSNDPTISTKSPCCTNPWIAANLIEHDTLPQVSQWWHPGQRSCIRNLSKFTASTMATNLYCERLSIFNSSWNNFTSADFSSWVFVIMDIKQRSIVCTPSLDSYNAITYNNLQMFSAWYNPTGFPLCCWAFKRC